MHQDEASAPTAREDRERSAALRTAWWAVGVLLLFYTLSTIDRTIINMMVQPLERDLHVTDFQISLLQGPAFGLFYVFVGLPMGWLVDRFSRRWIGALGVAVWGLATCFCGMASGVGQLTFGRMGVGVGESVLTPAAHSIIAEQFPHKRLSTAISVYTLGSVVGAGLALALGGTVVNLVTHMPPAHLPVFGVVRAWQLAFLVVGLPTVVLTPLMFTIVEQRARGRSSAPAAAGDGARASGALAFFRSHWKLVVGLPVAFGVTNILCYGFNAWIPTFMIRRFGWNPAQVGVSFGVVVLFGGVAGQMLGAFVVDWLYGRGVKDAHVRYHAAGLLITIPCAVAAFQCANPYLFLALIAVFFTVTYPFVGYAAAALQLFAPSRVRGQVSALFLAIITLIGVVLGPTAPAWLTDQVFHDKARLGLSLSIVCLAVAPVSILMMVLVARVMRGLQPDPAPVDLAELDVQEAY
jgi:MFS family permease